VEEKMKKSEIKGRAVHRNGVMRIDRRKGTAPNWEYQVLAMCDPDDPEPMWKPIPTEEADDFPEDGWESQEDWKGDED
jgi:hypothetical protein